MGTFNPTISTSIIPYVQILSADRTSYEEIQASQGVANYKAEHLYVKTENIEQLNEPITVQNYNVNGTQTENKRFNLADTNQYQPSKNIDLKKDKEKKKKNLKYGNLKKSLFVV